MDDADASSFYLLRRKIEATRESPWAADSLPDGITEAMRTKLQHLTNPTLAAFSQLIDISRHTLTGAASSAVKANLLAFLEPLCVDDAIAELLINTPLAGAIAETLSALNSSLKAQAALTLGLLVRHARQIDLPFVAAGAHPLSLTCSQVCCSPQLTPVEHVRARAVSMS